MAARRLFIPWKSKIPFQPTFVNETTPDSASDEEKSPSPAPIEDSKETLPEGVEPLVLWIDEQSNHQVVVDPMLTKFLRPHQREGVQFMFECVNGLRQFDGFGSFTIFRI